MKSNFFKIVLPAFALMLAITASLAFSPATGNDTDAYQQLNGMSSDIHAVPTECLIKRQCSKVNNGINCELNQTRLYGLDSAGTLCVIPLFKAIVE